MKAGIIFTGTGPILILTTYTSFSEPAFIEKMAQKGIMKFLAYELDTDVVRNIYGRKFDMIMNDVKQPDDLRVLDYNGYNVFHNFSLKDLAPPILVE